MDCIFCKIIDGVIPSYKVYEDENVLAFLDISQTTKGHTLVIPKTHVKNVYELTEATASNVFGVLPKIANTLKKAFNCNGINIVSNNEVAAGQTVFHFHVHLIPRYDENDSFKITYGTTNPSREEFDSMLQQIKNSF